MNEIRNVGAISATYTVAPKTITQEKEQIKPAEHEDKTAEIVTGLTLLGTTLAAVVLGIKGKHKKAAEALGQLTNEGQVLKQAQEKASVAVEQIANGGNYLKIKKEATKNLSHEGKKVVQEQIQNARVDRINAQKAQEIASKKASEAINQANVVVEQMNQGMGSAGVEEIQARVLNVQTAVQNANGNAKKLAQQAQINPTHQNIKVATQAEHSARQLEARAKKVEANAQGAMQNIADEIANKAENRAQMRQSPNFERGQELMQQHAQKTSENAIKKSAKNIQSKPGYQRAIADFERKGFATNPQKLQQIINSPKSSQWEVYAAQDILATLTSV